MTATVSRLCQGRHHATGTEGHDSGAAAHLVVIACPSCEWSADVALCDGRVQAIRESDCTMTCGACGTGAGWDAFWREVSSLAAAPASPRPSPSDAVSDPVQVIAAFVEYLESRRRAAGTIAQRVRHIRLLSGDLDIMTVRPEELDAWVRRQSVGRKPATVNTMVKSLRVFYAWADRFGLIRPNPATLLDEVPNPHRMGRTISDEAIAEALARAAPHERAMILLGREAGLRLTELTTLHTTMRDGEWLTIIGKGSKERRVFVTPRLARALDAVSPAEGGYYFPGLNGGHMHPQSVCKIIRRVTGANPHALRHAAGTAVYTATKDLRATQTFLGHGNPNTTAIYVHVSSDDLRDAALAGSGAPPA